MMLFDYFCSRWWFDCVDYFLLFNLMVLAITDFGLLYCFSLAVYLIVLPYCDIVDRCVVSFVWIDLLDLSCLHEWCFYCGWLRVG